MISIGQNAESLYGTCVLIVSAYMPFNIFVGNTAFLNLSTGIGM